MAYVKCEVLERRIRLTTPEIIAASADNLLELLFPMQLVITSDYLRTQHTTVLDH
jgi:hypothetical protein